MRHGIGHECDDEKTLIEYEYGSPERYDGISEIRCRHGRYGRWCGAKLAPNEIERRWCSGQAGQAHPTVPLGEKMPAIDPLLDEVG